MCWGHGVRHVYLNPSGKSKHTVFGGHVVFGRVQASTSISQLAPKNPAGGGYGKWASATEINLKVGGIVVEKQWAPEKFTLWISGFNAALLLTTQHASTKAHVCPRTWSTFYQTLPQITFNFLQNNFPQQVIILEKDPPKRLFLYTYTGLREKIHQFIFFFFMKYKSACLIPHVCMRVTMKDGQISHY